MFDGTPETHMPALRNCARPQLVMGRYGQSKTRNAFSESAIKPFIFNAFLLIQSARLPTLQFPRRSQIAFGGAP